MPRYVSMQQGTSRLISEINFFIYFSPDLGTYSSCFSEHMLVQVDLTQNPTLVASEMHLNDINCRATGINVTFASFEIPLSGCGTNRDGSDPDVLVFFNTVHWNPQQLPGQTQTRIAGFRSRIICRYARNGTVSVSFEPVQELSVEQTGMKCSKFFVCSTLIICPALKNQDQVIFTSLNHD